jgi:hypothetical protein
MTLSKKPILALRIHGDDLQPDELSRQLGCEPSAAFKKGDRNAGANGKEYAPRKTGMWKLDSPDSTDSVEERIRQLLSKVTESLDVWNALRAKFDLTLSVGMFMDSTNEELIFSSAVVELLGKRGISIWLDAYAPSDESAVDS